MGHCFCICVRSLLAKERHNDTWLSTSHTIAHCTCHTVRHSCIIRKKTARGPGLPFTFPYVHVWIWYYTVCVARCLDVTVLPSRCPSAPEVNRIVMANDRQHRKTADRCRKLCDVIVWALTACWLAGCCWRYPSFTPIQRRDVQLPVACPGQTMLLSALTNWRHHSAPTFVNALVQLQLHLATHLPFSSNNKI